MRLAFVKYEGLGNDFVVVDARERPAEVSIDGPLASRICDRHRGVGADGVLVLLPPRTRDAVASMRVLNADGSEAEMCGNGIRCVAKHVAESGGGRAVPSVLRFDTGAGLLTTEVELDVEGRVRDVTVDMGRARLERGEIPVQGDPRGRMIDETVEVAGRSLQLTAVSMGNPHAVTFDEVERTQAAFLGPALEHSASFPRKTNVEFARRRGPRAIDVVVWERGVGFTQACGTGACATAVAACVTGRSPFDESIAVGLPGGTLTITVGRDLQSIRMRGPARRVFEGTLDLTTFSETPASP